MIFNTQRRRSKDKYSEYCQCTQTLHSNVGRGFRFVCEISSRKVSLTSYQDRKLRACDSISVKALKMEFNGASGPCYWLYCNMNIILSFPKSRQHFIASGSQQQFIYNHGVQVDIASWRNKLTKAGLQLAGLPACTSAKGIKPTITRKDLFKLGESAADTPSDAFNLLWYTYAWGGRTSATRNLSKLLGGVVQNKGHVGSILQCAAQVSRTSPSAAFGLFKKPGSNINAIKWLGPSFFTKFLYFAGGGKAAHPCLILDERVAEALRDECGWIGLCSNGQCWTQDVYSTYCDLAVQFAASESTRVGRPRSS
jgi:hypothetical protein